MGLYSPTMNVYSANMRNSVPATDLTADELEDLLKSPKASAEFRILRATRRRLAITGLGVSIEEIAAEAGLGRSTVFRHFPSRDDLVARALTDSLTRFHAQVFDAINEVSDLDKWLLDVVATLHGSQIRAGRALWQLAASDDADLSAPIAQANRLRRDARKQLTRSIADVAWTKASGKGSAPQEIEMAFALAISSFAIHSLNVDYEVDESVSVASIASMLSAHLRERAAQ